MIPGLPEPLTCPKQPLLTLPPEAIYRHSGALAEKETRIICDMLPGWDISLNLYAMDSTQFFEQIRNGDLAGVQASLSKQPGLINAKDDRGSSPLLLAAYYNHKDLVSYLLEQGAAVDEKDGAGNTALMGVCFKGYTEVARLLIDAGADVNARNGMGGTCLTFAVTFKREDMAHLLIEKGADIHAADAQGNTALVQAKMQGLTNLAKFMESKS